MASSTDASGSASGIPLKYKIGVPLAIVFLFLCAVGIAFLATRYGKYSVKVIKLTGESTRYHAATAKNGQANSEPSDCGTKYNCSLEESSLKWANTVQCVMKHSHYPGVGENLFGITGEHTQEETANTATKPWADEIAKYGISALNEYRDEIGHATQVLWAETLTVGCGIKKCSNGWTMAVCQYYPP
ncbi:SCP-like protein [Necator americanus]|uniref:SCP-like protein n=1 Tax=Necator americanus TaxID=51031 RepID=W2TMS3_NECAM|nr:SCP-like protein [Necator americanus]ETN83405.1 SCP-like protein [Necator americanus]